MLAKSHPHFPQRSLRCWVPPGQPGRLAGSVLQQWASEPHQVQDLHILCGRKCTPFFLRNTDKTRGKTWKNMEKSYPEAQFLWVAKKVQTFAWQWAEPGLRRWGFYFNDVQRFQDPCCGPVRFSFSRSAPGAPYTTACPNGIGRSSCPSLNLKQHDDHWSIETKESKDDYTWEAQRPTNKKN
jgi:hypothetical protein